MNAQDKQLQKALELIQKQPKGLRSDAIGDLLKLDHTAVEEMLRPTVEAGKLLTCIIVRPERETVIEYKAPLAAIPGAFKFERPTPSVNPAKRPNFATFKPGRPIPTRQEVPEQPEGVPRPRRARRASSRRSTAPRPDSKQGKAIAHLETHGQSTKEDLADVMGVKAIDVCAYMTPLLKKGLVVARKVEGGQKPPSNEYLLPHQLEQSSTPQPAGEQGKPAIEPTESANSEGFDTATQPSSSAATPPGSNDEGQCSQITLEADPQYADELLVTLNFPKGLYCVLPPDIDIAIGETLVALDKKLHGPRLAAYNSAKNIVSRTGHDESAYAADAPGHRRFWPIGGIPPDPEQVHLARRCGFAVDDEGFVGIGDGKHGVKLTPADVEAFLTWADRARPLWQQT